MIQIQLFTGVKKTRLILDALYACDHVISALTILAAAAFVLGRSQDLRCSVRE